MQSIRRGVFSFTVFISLSFFGYSQEILDLGLNNSEFWADMTLSKSLSEHWTVGGDYGLRSSLNTDGFWQFYIRPSVNYNISPIYDFTFGIGTFNTFNEESFNTYEFRMYQDVNIHWPRVGIFNFSHRFRFEERFFSYSDDEVSGEFQFRGRYLLATRTEKFSIREDKKWTVYGSLEPFFVLENETNNISVNNFRWDTALCYHASKNFRLELHYILQTSQIFSNTNSSVEDHLIRLRVFQKL